VQAAGESRRTRTKQGEAEVLAFVATKNHLLQLVRLSPVKTSCTRKMNDLQTSLMRSVSLRFWP